MLIYILIILAVILAIYSVVITLLYLKIRKEKERVTKLSEGKVEKKIYEVKERLHDLDHTRYPKVEIKEDGE